MLSAGLTPGMAWETDRSPETGQSSEPRPTAAQRTADVKFPDATLENESFEAKGDPLQPLKGSRTGVEPGGKAPAAREWFGQPKPLWQWTHLAGDWGGARPALEEHGLALEMKYTFDGASVLRNGIRRHSVGAGLLDLRMTVDTEAAFDLKGGTVFAQYYFRHGRSGNDNAGTAQGYSNIDEERLSRAEEIWYEQKFAGGRGRIKVGQVDANAEFDFVEAAAEFINPTAGFSPTIAGFDTYPNPALSLNVFVHPTGQIYAGAGVYTDNFKEMSARSFDRPFFIGEVGLTHGGEGRFANGRVAVGAWRDTATLDRFAGGSQAGTDGYYVVAEQVVWKENVEDKEDAQGVSVFAQYGQADSEVSRFARHCACGFCAVGTLAGRDDDATGIRLSWVALSRAAGSGFDADETNLEVFYKAQITPAVSVKPGLQWVHHPGGLRAADDTVLGTLRVSVQF